MTSEARKIFSPVATGGSDTPRHHFDTIKTKRAAYSVPRFLSHDKLRDLNDVMAKKLPLPQNHKFI